MREHGLGRRRPVTSHAIFHNIDKIKNTYGTNEKGVIVVQTSTAPGTVTAFRANAGEVTDLARGNVAALHTAMLRNKVA